MKRNVAPTTRPDIRRTKRASCEEHTAQTGSADARNDAQGIFVASSSRFTLFPMSLRSCGTFDIRDTEDRMGGESTRGSSK